MEDPTDRHAIAALPLLDARINNRTPLNPIGHSSTLKLLSLSSSSLVPVPPVKGNANHTRKSSNTSSEACSESERTITSRTLAPLYPRPTQKPKPTKTTFLPHGDFHLMTALASKLNATELVLNHANHICRAHERTIKTQAQFIESFKDKSLDCEYVEYLEGKCESLEGRIIELENQLSRFATVPIPMQVTEVRRESFPFNIVHIKQSLLELNVLAGEGVSQIVTDKHGTSTFKVLLLSW